MQGCKVLEEWICLWRITLLLITCTIYDVLWSCTQNVFYAYWVTYRSHKHLMKSQKLLPFTGIISGDHAIWTIKVNVRNSRIIVCIVTFEWHIVTSLPKLLFVFMEWSTLKAERKISSKPWNSMKTIFLTELKAMKKSR